jgi:hypothetical protein
MELAAHEASTYACAATPDASVFNVDDRLLSKPLLRPPLIGPRVSQTLNSLHIIFLFVA